MGILQFLKSNRNTRKIFGERELKIIEKQLQGVNLTQSEKNRLSRDIRKKFEFIRGAATFSHEFELKKGAEIKKMIEEAEEIILNDILFSRIKRIILYGSAAEKKMTLGSDIDLAVEFSDIGLKEATLFRKRVSGKINQRVDVQAYNFLPKKIISEIELKGKIIYKK